MKNLILLFGIILFLSSCSTSKSNKPVEGITTTTEKIAENNFESDYIITYSKYKRYAAISKKLDTEPYTLKIMVYDTKENRVLWGKKAIKGKLEWISRKELQINYVTKQNKRNTLIYNTKTKQITYK